MYDLHDFDSAHHTSNDSTPDDSSPKSLFDATHNNLATPHSSFVSSDDDHTSTVYIYDDSAAESLHGDNAAGRFANPDSINKSDRAPFHLNSEAYRENTAKCLLSDCDRRRSIMLGG